jgi:hypothetical protein
LELTFDANPPVVFLTRPFDGSEFTQGDEITLEAIGLAGDRQIRQVDFAVMHGPRLSSSPPFSTLWTNAPPGRHWVRAEAIDGQGMRWVSPHLEFIIRPRNDLFENRLALAGAELEVTASTREARQEKNESNLHLEGSVWWSEGTVWWSWTPPDSGYYTVEAFTSWDSPAPLALFSGASLDQLVEVISHPELAGSAPYSTRKVVSVTGGETYQVQIGQSWGDVTLRITRKPAPVIRLVAPMEGARYSSPAQVRLFAEVDNPQGELREVAFFVHGRLAAKLTQPPFEQIGAGAIRSAVDRVDSSRTRRHFLGRAGVNQAGCHLPCRGFGSGRHCHLGRVFCEWRIGWNLVCASLPACRFTTARRALDIFGFITTRRPFLRLEDQGGRLVPEDFLRTISGCFSRWCRLGCMEPAAGFKVKIQEFGLSSRKFSSPPQRG